MQNTTKTKATYDAAQEAVRAARETLEARRNDCERFAPRPAPARAQLARDEAQLAVYRAEREESLAAFALRDALLEEEAEAGDADAVTLRDAVPSLMGLAEEVARLRAELTEKERELGGRGRAIAEAGDRIAQRRIAAKLPQPYKQPATLPRAVVLLHQHAGQGATMQLVRDVGVALSQHGLGSITLVDDVAGSPEAKLEALITGRYADAIRLKNMDQRISRAAGDVERLQIEIAEREIEEAKERAEADAYARHVAEERRRQEAAAAKEREKEHAKQVAELEAKRERARQHFAKDVP